MAIQSFQLDPNASAPTDDQIVDAINNASNTITRAGAVSSTARPIQANEITAAELASGVAKANLDSMSDTARGYVQSAPVTGQFPVTALARSSTGELQVSYDDVAIS